MHTALTHDTAEHVCVYTLSNQIEGRRVLCSTLRVSTVHPSKWLTFSDEMGTTLVTQEVSNIRKRKTGTWIE